MPIGEGLRTQVVQLQGSESLYRCQLTVFAYDTPQVDAAYDAAYGCLSSAERAYCDRLKVRKRALEFTFGRYVAKEAARAAADGALARESFEIRQGLFNQPILVCPDGRDLEVSIAHSNGVAMALVHPRACPLGIDLEVLDGRTLSTMTEHLTEHESALMDRHPVASDRSYLPAVIWTAKESLSKVFKSGLLVPFDLFEVQSISTRSEVMTSAFRSFSHYVAASARVGDFVASIAYPKMTDLRTESGAPFPSLALPGSSQAG
ncbi:4'-phosphopantetheinyl transferase family protein [Phytoactinopolyspora halophila]|nr:4'-phosphopantetheinyl transferase superfamily protein [Phytoactinopolyspora halophila]